MGSGYSRDVVCIAAETAAKVPGVASLGASLSEAAAKKIGHTGPAQGVDAVFSDHSAELTIRLVVQHGCRIPDIALHVQQSVKDAVEVQTGYRVTAVHIWVQRIAFDSAAYR